VVVVVVVVVVESFRSAFIIGVFGASGVAGVETGAGVSSVFYNI
jgi:hypothetical protein